MAKKIKKMWVAHVQETSNAMDLPEGLFRRSSKGIAQGLKRAALASNRTKGTKFQSAMSMLNFYINRAGKNLSPTDKDRLEKAKDELRKILPKRYQTTSNKKSVITIKILGTRGEIEESAPYHSKKSGVLINDELLLDMGDPSFVSYKPRAVLITHLHPDHAYFVRHHETPSFAMNIYAPEAYDGVKIIVKKRKFKIGSYTITPIPTVHSIKVASHAYLIEYQGKRILYTGDMIWIEKKYQKKLGNLDLVITEASFMRKGGMVRRNKTTGKIYGHTGIENLVNLFKKHTHTIILTHFGAWFYKNMQKAQKGIQELARDHGVKIIVGYDGMKIRI